MVGKEMNFRSALVTCGVKEGKKERKGGGGDEEAKEWVDTDQVPPFDPLEHRSPHFDKMIRDVMLRDEIPFFGLELGCV